MLSVVGGNFSPAPGVSYWQPWPTLCSSGPS
jgi:hypothetical protein